MSWAEEFRNEIWQPIKIVSKAFIARLLEYGWILACLSFIGVGAGSIILMSWILEIESPSKIDLRDTAINIAIPIGSIIFGIFGLYGYHMEVSRKTDRLLQQLNLRLDVAVLSKNQVAEIQKMLRSLDPLYSLQIDEREIDGRGYEFNRAIRTFQLLHHLETDGICGPQTYKILKEEYERQQFLTGAD